MDALFPVLWMSLLRVSAVLALGLVAASLLRRASASARHLLLVLSVIGALAVPLLSLTLPEVRVSLPISNLHCVALNRISSNPLSSGRGVGVRADQLSNWFKSAITPPSTPPVDAQPQESSASVTSPVHPALPTPPVAETTAAPQPLPAEESASPAPAATTHFTFSAIPPVTWLWLWGAGAVALLVRLLLGMIAARRIIRRAEGAENAVHAIAAQATEALGLRSVPTVLVSSGVATPAISGVFRVCVLLPATVSAWPAEMLRAALLHEFAHIRRRDTFTHLLVELLRAVYWFNPLAWWTAQRMRIEREIACDDAVLNAGVPNRAYADVLLESVKPLHGRRAPAFAGLAMARTTKLKRRLLDIMNPRRNRKPLTILGIILLTLAAVAVAILAALPGARTKINKLTTPKPLPENQHLIVTKDKWRLRGPVKRVELYNGERWDDKTNPPKLMETLDFDQAGHVIREEKYSWYNSDVITTTWQYDTQGLLVESGYAMDMEKQTPVSIASDSAGPQLILPWNNAYEFITPEQSSRLYWQPPYRYMTEYDRRGAMQTARIIPEDEHHTGNLRSDQNESSSSSSRTFRNIERPDSLHCTYDKQGNPISVKVFSKGDVGWQSTLAYQYDAAGNWVAQRREDTSPTGKLRKATYHYLRRIAYYPDTQLDDKPAGIRLTRETFGLRGPVTAIEGQSVSYRLNDLLGGGSDYLSIDRVEFNREGMVSAISHWDGEQTPDNLKGSEQFAYYEDDTLRTRTVRHELRSGGVSYASRLKKFSPRQSFLPTRRSFNVGGDFKRVTRFDEHGRIIEEQETHDKDYSARAVYQYRGDDGIITVTGSDGKTTDVIRAHVTRDRYGNLLSRRYDWDMEEGAPSELSEEIHYRLSYAGKSTSGKAAGGERSRGVRIQTADSQLHGASEITISGPVPHTMSAALLPLGDKLYLLYSTDYAAGWFPFRANGGAVRAVEYGMSYFWDSSIRAITCASGPKPTEGIVALQTYNNLSGTAEGTWRLAFYQLSRTPHGALNPQMRAERAPYPWSTIGYHPRIEYASQNAHLVWLPEQKRYLAAAEHMPETPDIAVATVNIDGTTEGSQVLPYSGYSPRVARTRNGVALCYVQRDRFAQKGVIRFASSKDGKKWTNSRPLFPRLANPKEVAMVGDGAGTLHLLALCHTPQAAASETTPALLYHAVSRDSGATWTIPKQIAAFESVYTDSPAISLTMDAKEKLWYSCAVLRPWRKNDPSIPTRRTSAKIIVGRLDY